MDFESKNRIRKRRYDLLKQEIDKSNYSSKNKSKSLSFLSSLCILCSIALGVLIYGKNDENGKWIKENFGIEVSFSKVNSYISKYTALYFPIILPLHLYFFIFVLQKTAFLSNLY